MDEKAKDTVVAEAKPAKEEAAPAAKVEEKKPEPKKAEEKKAEAKPAEKKAEEKKVEEKKPEEKKVEVKKVEEKKPEAKPAPAPAPKKAETKPTSNKIESKVLVAPIPVYTRPNSKYATITGKIVGAIKIYPTVFKDPEDVEYMLVEYPAPGMGVKITSYATKEDLDKYTK